MLERGIAEVARKYSMDWRVSFSTKQKRLALLVRYAPAGLGGVGGGYSAPLPVQPADTLPSHSLTHHPVLTPHPTPALPRSKLDHCLYGVLIHHRRHPFHAAQE